MEVLAELSVRDVSDRTRADSPLVAAPDATVLDTTGRSVEEVVSEVVNLARRAHPSPPPGGGPTAAPAG